MHYTGNCKWVINKFGDTPSSDNTILSLNPFTYRGYQFDRETGLYYLQSRYFNPQWCQFINADTNLDTQTSIIGTNIFAYCDNNPVMRIDPTGQTSENILSIFFEVYIIAAVCNQLTGVFGNSNLDDYLLEDFKKKLTSSFYKHGCIAYGVSLAVEKNLYYIDMVIGSYDSWKNLANWLTNSPNRAGSLMGDLLANAKKLFSYFGSFNQLYI